MISRPVVRLGLQAVLLAAPAALACRGGGDAAPSRNTLVDSRDTYDPKTLDPARATDVPSGRAVAYLFDGLVQFTPDAHLAPALASRWEITPDGRTYTFHLRQGVTFSDGKPLLARHVVASFRRLLDPAVKAGSTDPVDPIAGASEVKSGKATTISGLTAPNDSTVVITLERPLAVYLKLLAMPVASILPESVTANFSEKPVGTGPWRLVEWKHDDYLRFARNEKYWGGAAKAESLMARVIPEPSTSVAEFESGNVDILYIPEGETRNWEQTDERKAMLQAAPVLRLWYVGINTTRGPLTDPRVRQAINMAIDRKTMLEQLIAGRGKLAAGVIPPALDGYDGARTPYAFDPARAKQLLAEAGHPNGIDVELWCSQEPTFARVAQTIQSYLGQANIRAKIVQRDAASMRAAARNGQTDLVVKDWYADYPDAENFLYPLLHSERKGTGGNVSFYANADYDRIVSAARVEQDSIKRVALYRQADSVAFKDAPMVFLWFYNELYAVQPWVKGWTAPVIFNGQRWLSTTIQR